MLNQIISSIKVSCCIFRNFISKPEILFVRIICLCMFDGVRVKTDSRPSQHHDVNGIGFCVITDSRIDVITHCIRHVVICCSGLQMFIMLYVHIIVGTDDIIIFCFQLIGPQAVYQKHVKRADQQRVSDIR